ncbi:hypothetical protein K402DRAFT_400705 [Aulographum hederae CBS 113979]|uniref:Potassium transport protein n=1 Tax=Aulographum hederae CBS 113979 TaxID=1176131 RepID=A0A6G1HDL1_9PEZI|nr:hypothetical protein K402DRAFT_400705 [Aulographum hederae CBS 113979]
MLSGVVEWEARVSEPTRNWLRKKFPKPTWVSKISSWIPAGVKLKVPKLVKHFNFLAIHYTFMLTMTMVGSVILYGERNMEYIDCLFFASGAATQSGLNTVDINLLKLYQQITLMIMAGLCNPIFINTVVVFVRLYWFEKRFQGVVKEAKMLRRTRTRSRTKSEMKQEQDLDKEERGVGGRMITVQRDEEGKAVGHKMDDERSRSFGQVQNSGSSSDSSNEKITRESDSPELKGSLKGGHIDFAREQLRTPTSPRNISFQDEVDRPKRKISMELIPEHRGSDHHIAFVENQRNPKKTGKLRIPGPRDFDRGDTIQHLEDEDDGGDLTRRNTTNSSVDQDDHTPMERFLPAQNAAEGELNGDDHPEKHITIDLPASHRNRDREGDAHSTGRSQQTLGLRRRGRSTTLQSFMSAKSQDRDRDPMPYLSYAPTLGRNSTFVDLSEEQREELGGIEYRSLKTLAWTLIFYYVGLHILGIVIFLPWIITDDRYGSYVNSMGLSRGWWGVFTPWSMFTDLGFTLTPDSMITFQEAVLPLVLGIFLIIAGNTGFPCLLRFVIWCASLVVPWGTGLWEELKFLLDHPRRCFTLLFPRSATWWLFGILVALNGIDLIFFIILDLNDPAVTHLSGGFQFLDGLFQAASTRTAGFSVVNLADLHPAIQVSYLVMMYISIFPIAISVRRTNVYEEKSLGIYAGEAEDESNPNPSYVGTHARRQLSFDLWYIFLGLFLICIIEGDRLENTNEFAFTTFSVLFEIVSAYGTVGLSLGYPGVNTSFSGQFRTLSKLIIIAMQLRGRHRGLPYALDRAILLPSESLQRKEAAEAARRAAMQRERRNSVSSAVTGDGVGENGVSRETSGIHETQGHGHTRGESTVTRRNFPGISRIMSGAFTAGPSKKKRRYSL